MKKLFLAAVAVMMTAFSVNAQVRIQSPHPDLDFKITRCANANGTVIVDVVITNFGMDEDIRLEEWWIKMYDDEGNSYDNNNSKIRFGFPNKEMVWRGGFTFPQDIPLKFRFQFGDISSRASTLSLIKIGMSSNGAMSLSEDKPLLIRNLEWAK